MFKDYRVYRGVKEIREIREHKAHKEHRDSVVTLDLRAYRDFKESKDLWVS